MNQELHQMKMEFTNLQASRPSMVRSALKSTFLYPLYSILIILSIICLVFTDSIFVSLLEQIDKNFTDPEINSITLAIRISLGLFALFLFLLKRRIYQVMERNIYIMDMLDWIENKMESLEKVQPKK